MMLSNGMLLRQTQWEYLKPLIEKYPETARDTILDGLTRFWTGYDRVEKQITIEPLRYISGPYSGRSYVSLVGTIRSKKAVAFLKFNYRGRSWLFAERIKVVADDYVWQSPELGFHRDHSTEVWESAHLDLEDPAVRRLAVAIMDAKEAIVRFQGRQYHSDLVVTDRMKSDLRAIVDALDRINEASM